MNKSLSYSPFNRTYKFMFLQNQRAHSNNKRYVKSQTKSNLRLSKKDIHDLQCLSVSRKKHLRCRTEFSNNNDEEEEMSQIGEKIVGSVKKLPIKIHKNSKAQKYRNF